MSLKSGLDFLARKFTVQENTGIDGSNISGQESRKKDTSRTRPAPEHENPSTSGPSGSSTCEYNAESAGIPDAMSSKNTGLTDAEEITASPDMARSTFLAGMSHDLRTPLNAIIGFSDLMSRDTNLTPDQQRNLEAIEKSGRYILKLINEILEISKLEAGKTTSTPEDTDLFLLLDELEKRFGKNAQNKELQLSLNRCVGLPRYIQVDRDKLCQILTNLLDNSIKFTKSGGVCLSVFRQQANDAGSNAGEYSLVLEVTDSGEHIAPGDIEQIFAAYAPKKSNRLRDGTGLNLPISRAFAQLMNGDLTVENNTDSGVRFRLVLPLKTAVNASSPNKSPGQRVKGLEAGQPEFRILVVEDNDFSRRLLVKLLTKTGFTVQQAGDGRKAVEVWHDFKPHLIWMDMRMPVMDGCAATRQIRTESSENRPVVIALTASIFPEEESIAACGCDDYLPKPYETADLFDIMHRYLGVRYVFETEKEEMQAAPDILSSKDFQAAFSGLSKDIRAGLYKALRAADLDAANSFAAAVRQHNAPLAQQIENLLESYRFDLLEQYLAGEAEGRESRIGKNRSKKDQHVSDKRHKRHPDC